MSMTCQYLPLSSIVPLTPRPVSRSTKKGELPQCLINDQEWD